MNLGGVEQYQNVTGSSCGYDSHIDYNKLRDEIKTKEDELEMEKISTLSLIKPFSSSTPTPMSTLTLI